MSTIFKDERLTENGRSKLLDDSDFNDLVDMYQKCDSKLGEYLKNHLFKNIDNKLLNDHNKQILENILNHIRWEECISFIEHEIDRYSNMRLIDLKGGEEEYLKAYNLLLEYARSETYEWMVHKMYWWVTDYNANIFYGLSDASRHRFKVAKLLFKQYNLGDLLKDEYKKKFESATL